MSTTLNINGQDVEVSVDETTPLLWVLRDTLKLTGTKYGCGMGLCGACTVLMNGNPVRSCSLPVSAVQGTRISTIESLGGDHPLQAAWISNSVPQCGYCQSGQIMSAHALLNKTPAPTDTDIDNAMNGNICRCGTYPRIRQAIKDAAVMMYPAEGGKS